MTTKPSSLSSMAPANPKATQKPRKAAKSPRWTMLNTFWDETVRRLTPGAVVVWGILYRNANKTGLVKITQEQIAERSPFGKRQVINHMIKLEKLGCLKVVSRGSRNRGPSWIQLYDGSRCNILQPEAESSTCRKLQPEESLKVKKPALCYMQDIAPTTELKRAKTPAAAFSALAEEEDLRSEPNGIGGGL